MKQIFIFLSIMVMFTFVFGGDMLEPGTKAPDFELADESEKMHKLSDYRGKIVALYFYPKDDTPGCTAEACNLRDNYQTLRENDVAILGVSFDEKESHQNFKEKYNLPFTLLSDTGKEVAEKYGATRGLLGFIGPKRITYLIGKDGKIMHVFEEVDSDNHAAQILEVLNQEK